VKVILIILLVIGALMLGHNYVQTGKIGFNVSLSQDEVELRRLADSLSEAVSAYKVAGRGTSIGGMAPDSNVETAMATVRRVERELAALEPRFNDADVDAKAEVEKLKGKIRAARQLMGIPEEPY